MATTQTIKHQAVPGAYVRKNVLVALDNSYPNPGGYVFTPASFGFSTLRSVSFAGCATIPAAANTVVIEPTYATDSSGNITSFALHLVVKTTDAEVANAVDVSATSLLFEVEGN